MTRLTHSVCCLLLALCGIAFTACDHNKSPHSPESPDNSDKSSSRVIFAYMVAENNLSGIASSDIREMLAGCKYMSDNDRLVIYLDDASDKLPAFYEITNKTEETYLYALTPVKTYSEDFNSASPETLDMALRYVYDYYPADSYGIVFWSHASGWTPSNYKQRTKTSRAFGVDTGNNNSFTSWGEQMNIDDMADVLEKYHDIDFLLFDACFMQSIEVAYELRNTADYILASPAEIPGPGAPYNLMVQPMFADTLNMEEVMTAYYTYYSQNLDYGVLLSVVDCAELENFANIHSKMLDTYKDSLGTLDFSSLQNYFRFDQWHRMTDIPDCYDMKGVMQKTITDEEDLNEWLTAYKRILPYSCATEWWYTDYAGGYMYVYPNQYSGMSMYVEQDKYKGHYFYDAYYKTAWAKATGY